MCITQFLCFWRSRTQKPSSTNLKAINPVSGEHSSLSHPSPSLGTSQRVTTGPHPIVGAQDNSASQLAHVSRLVTPPTILEHSFLGQESLPSESLAKPAIHPSQATTFAPPKHDLLVTPQRLSAAATASQQSLVSQLLAQPHDGNSNIVCDYQSIYDSRNVSVDGNMNTVTYINTVVESVNNFMKEFLTQTIPGAAFDSSARDPPPRCHPGTRLAILERCLQFIADCSDKKKIRWVFGAAGVGKSAIMQSVAESPLPSVTLRASIFFLVNGRSDGTKAILTLAYQFAAKCEPYCQFIEREITRDPSLLQASMSAQFNKFVTEPFIHHHILDSACYILIIIDGLDECDGSRTQRELLRLISDFCLAYPSSPLVWMIASRPEPHIVSFFAQDSVEGTYEKEEILVDTDDAREDVERFLRMELRRIQIEFSLNPKIQWPTELDIWKLANASGGLFVYAQTLMKYIGDPDIGNPILQLNDVLEAIDSHPLPNIPREEHPMASLDALYSRILSKIPTKVTEHMRKFLLALAVNWEGLLDPEGRNFIVLCNWLGMTYDQAYAALRHLSSLLDIPGRDAAHKKELRSFHKSFIDYISDFVRSGFSPDITREAHELYVQCTFRIIEQAPDGIDVGDVNYFVRGGYSVGTLTRGPGTGSKIALTWPVDEESDWDDNKTRLYMYKLALASVVDGIRRGQQAFCTVFCIRLLAARFQSFVVLGIRKYHEILFDKSRRREFMEQGLLQQIPIKMLNFPDITWETVLQFCRPDSPVTNLPDPWNPSCIHKRENELGEGTYQAWTTEFRVGTKAFLGGCDSCCQRLERQLNSWKARFPEHPVSVLFTSAGVGFVELQFVDVEDGMSEWTYWFTHKFEQEECQS